MSFNPKDFMMKLKGKDYMPVQGRMVWYRDENKENTKERILDRQINIEKGFAYFEVELTDSKGNVVVGVGSETSKDFGDFIEKAYTKAYGRALAALGYGTQFAPELEEGERIVDSPSMKNAAKVPSQTPPPVPTGTISKDQMTKIANLMPKAGLDSVAMSIMTTELFSKGKAIELSVEEADRLIATLEEKIANK